MWDELHARMKLERAQVPDRWRHRRCAGLQAQTMRGALGRFLADGDISVCNNPIDESLPHRWTPVG
jgi:hypothetical protein